MWYAVSRPYKFRRNFRELSHWITVFAAMTAKTKMPMNTTPPFEVADVNGRHD
ncbi:MAG: hypothetical protein HAW66_04655 [Shewanella sp.]|nr:hypothetical protein [Shewanella sp.]